MSAGALERLIETWDEAVDDFLAGRTSLSPDLAAWFASYAGKGSGAVDPEAMPEPFLGPLKPHGAKVVFLALNPGRPFAFQRRDGFFAKRVRECGSYSKWAATWPYIDGDWEAANQPPNRHHQARLKFMRTWFGDEGLTAESMVAFELYPWHSTRVTATIRPDPELIKRYIWEPIAELGRPLVFAFGAPWFPILRDHLELDVVASLGRGGDDYGSSVPSRSVVALEGPNGVKVVAERHAGSAGPPSAAETAKLKTAFARFPRLPQG